MDRRSYFGAAVFVAIEFVVVVFDAVEFDAIALVSAGAVVVVVVVLVSVAVALVSAVLVSAFFWQAETPRARAAATATEVAIRSFMWNCSPGGLSPDAASHTRLCDFPKS
jgi:hypothetical protein